MLHAKHSKLAHIPLNVVTLLRKIYTLAVVLIIGKSTFDYFINVLPHYMHCMQRGQPRESCLSIRLSNA